MKVELFLRLVLKNHISRLGTQPQALILKLVCFQNPELIVLLLPVLLYQIEGRWQKHTLRLIFLKENVLYIIKVIIPFHPYFLT